MVGVRERPPAADSDEPGVTVLGQDHGSTVRRCCTIPQRWVVTPIASHPRSRSTRSGSGKLPHGTTLVTSTLSRRYAKLLLEQRRRVGRASWDAPASAWGAVDVTRGVRATSKI
jgi:hypothetical protein